VTRPASRLVSTAVSPLKRAKRDYLRLRQGLGHQLAEAQRLLASFVAFLQEHDPRVRQSGGQLATLGWITKACRAHARGMLVEVAWAVPFGRPATRCEASRPIGTSKG